MESLYICHLLRVNKEGKIRKIVHLCLNKAAAVGLARGSVRKQADNNSLAWPVPGTLLPRPTCELRAAPPANRDTIC